MSSQQRRTFDTDIITLRTVNIRGSSNSLIPGGKVLTSDGLGGTVWVNPSTATGLRYSNIYSVTGMMPYAGRV
jgi:hypothetical protein